MKSHWRELALILIVVSAAATVSYAAPVTFTYEAEVATVPSGSMPFGMDIPRLTRVTGSFTYETTTADTDTNPQRGTYPHTSGGAFTAVFELQSGNVTITGSSTPTTQVEDFNPDTFRYNDGGAQRVMQIDGVDDPDITLGFSITSSSGVVPNDALPDPFPWSAGEPHTFSIGDDQGGVLLQFTTLTPVVPQPPMAVDDMFSVEQDSTLTAGAPGVLANDTPAGGTLAAAVDTQPSNGTLTLNPDGSFTYTPSTGFTGTDTFTYTTSDGAQISAPATVTITVTPVAPPNNPPVAADDAYQTQQDQPLAVSAPGVLSNDSDADGDAITAVVGTGPTNAAAFNLNPDGSFDYTPATGFSGTDSFTYSANDGTDASTPATVTITVVAAPPPPPPTDCITMLSALADSYEALVESTLAQQLPAIASLLAAGDTSGAAALQQSTVNMLVQEAGVTVTAIQTECTNCASVLQAQGADHFLPALDNACLIQMHRVGSLQASATARLENAVGRARPPRVARVLANNYVDSMLQNENQTVAALEVFAERYTDAIAGHLANGDTAAADMSATIARQMVERTANARIARIEQLCQAYIAKASRWPGAGELVAFVTSAANDAMTQIQIAQLETLQAIDAARAGS